MHEGFTQNRRICLFIENFIQMMFGTKRHSAKHCSAQITLFN